MVDYDAFPSDGAIVSVNRQSVLPVDASGSGSIRSWAQGFFWQNNATHLGVLQIPNHPRPQVLTNGGPNSPFFVKSRPNWPEGERVDVTTLGLVGDGKTDNTVAFQLLAKKYAEKLALFFPSGMLASLPS
jgi:hypothetical protein